MLLKVRSPWPNTVPTPLSGILISSGRGGPGDALRALFARGSHLRAFRLSAQGSPVAEWLATVSAPVPRRERSRDIRKAFAIYFSSDRPRRPDRGCR